MKKQKGITLVALIITIIVMLILVGVTITLVLNGGLFDTAKEARDKTEKSVKEESELSQYEYEIAKAKGEVTDEDILKYDYGVKIGDKIDYKEGTGYASEIDSNFVMDDLDWRVLGVNEKGQIELISTKPTTSKLKLSGEEGYLNAETNLNTLCNDLYGKGEYAAGARSLNVEDVNKLANFVPTYGGEYQYRYSTEVENLQYRKSTDEGTTWNPDWTNIPDGYTKSFKAPGEAIINASNPTTSRELEYTWYNYPMTSRRRYNIRWNKNRKINNSRFK